MNTQVTGNAGLYYACYRLSCMGWNVMPTSRNARGIDIIAYNTEGSRFIGIQVKTLSKRTSVLMGTSVDKIMGDFWVIVNNVAKDPSAFVLLPAEVTDRAVRGERDGRVTYYLPLGSYDTPDFREAWGRIGQADGAV